MDLPSPDTNNIIDLMPDQLSATNQKTVKQFRFFSLLYDPMMEYFIRPRIHKANPAKHRRIWHELIGSVQQAQILDLACGTGGLIACMEKGNDYTGLDLSYEMLKKAERRARKKGFSKYRMVRGNAEEQVFSEASFDLIVSDTALHMIPHWQMALSYAAKSLTPQGRLVCALPVIGINEDFDKGWKKHSDRPQFHALTQDDLQQACTTSHLDFSVAATNGGVLYFQSQKK